MDLGELEKVLEYQFRDRRLLERAVTHRSWAHENLAGESEDNVRAAQNESLEFVGDSVVGLVVAETLYRTHPTLSEGDLTLMKHSLVSTNTLASIAARIGIGAYVRLGRGEEKTGGRSKPAILADTLEAVIAAVFFDGGYQAASNCIELVFAAEFAAATPTESGDYKTMLQEKLQGMKMLAPKYALVRSEGMPHSRTFIVEAVWEGGRSIGTGRSIKSAEMMAASEALTALAANETSSSDPRI